MRDAEGAMGTSSCSSAAMSSSARATSSPRARSGAAHGARARSSCRNGWDDAAFPVHRVVAASARTARSSSCTSARSRRGSISRRCARVATPVSRRVDTADRAGRRPGLRDAPGSASSRRSSIASWRSAASERARAAASVPRRRAHARRRSGEALRIHRARKTDPASHWPALDRFAAFVTFYRDSADLIALVASRRVATPPSVESRRAFLEPQSWAARAGAFRAAVELARNPANDERLP